MHPGDPSESQTFQTRFVYQLGRGRMSECGIEVEKSRDGHLKVTVLESSPQPGGLVHRQFGAISTQIYGRLLRGVPVGRIHWAYSCRTSESDSSFHQEIELLWDGSRFFLPLFHGDSSARGTSAEDTSATGSC